MVRSIIQQTAMSSPIRAASNLSPKEGKNRKSLVAGLMITSLVDAFSILVIFLLASFSKSGEVLSLSKNMELPPASLSDELKRTTLIKLDSGKIFVEDKEVTIKNLIKILIGIRKQVSASSGNDQNVEPSLTVQADRRVPYHELSQIVLAGAQSGFGEVRFAVLAK